jgi:hypothetical protein
MKSILFRRPPPRLAASPRPFRADFEAGVCQDSAAGRTKCNRTEALCQCGVPRNGNLALGRFSAEYPHKPFVGDGGEDKQRQSARVRIIKDDENRSHSSKRVVA